MSSTEDYLDNLLANAVGQEKSSQKTKVNAGSSDASSNIREDIRRTSSSFSSAEARLDSLLTGNNEDKYRQPLETEAGDVIGLDDTLPEEYIDSKAADIKPAEDKPLDNKTFEDKTHQNTKDTIGTENKSIDIKDINDAGFEEFNPSSKFESFLSEFGEEDIEKRLAQAADVSDVTNKIDDSAEVTEIIDAISEGGDSSMNDIADLLKASDNNKIVDTSLLEKLDKAEAMADSDASDEEENETDDSESGKKKKGRKKKDKKEKKSKEKGTGLFGKLFGKKDKNPVEEPSIDMDYEEGISGADSEKELDDDFDKLLAETAASAGHPLITDDEDEASANLGEMSLDAGESSSDEETLSDNGIDAGESDDAVPETALIDEDASEGATKDEAEGEPEDSNEDGENAKPKKKGLLAKILDFLTEEEPELTAGEDSNLLSDENKAILDEVDAEDEGKKKGKKGKKEKKAKEPKEKKPKKPKKPKKEKVQEPIDPKKIVPMKMKITIFALALSVLAIVLLLMKFVPGMMNMSDARKAYYAKDYKDTFISLYGKKLGDSDRILYEKAKILVLIERKYESYENYMTMDMPIQALDALLQGLVKYETVKERAEEYGVLNDLNQIRDKLLAALALQFGVNEAEAMEIIEYSPVDYTLKLQSIVEGTPFMKVQDMINSGIGLEPITDDGAENEQTGDEIFPDMLPEEENIPNPVNDTTNSDISIQNIQGDGIEILIESEQF